MGYIDLEERVPQVDTRYELLIENLDGEQRKSQGDWVCCEGFELISDSLADDEYILGWGKK